MNTPDSNLIVFDQATIKAKKYWLEKLSNRVENCNLRLDSSRGKHVATDLDCVELHLHRSLQQKLNNLTHGNAFLLYTALMTALNIYLYKYTGLTSIVVGSPSKKYGEGKVVADNMLAIINEISPDMSFRDFLLTVQQTLVEAYRHQSYPFHYLLKDLGLHSIENKCPLFDIAVVFEDIHAPAPQVKQDITLLFATESNQIVGRILFNKHLFRKETIQCFAQQFVSLLHNCLSEVSSPIKMLPILDELEQNQLLAGVESELNQQRTSDAFQTCLHLLFEAQVERTPSATAVTCGSDSLSYDRLNCRANQLAHYLRKQGIGPEDPVAIYTEHSLDMITSVMGVLKAGGAYIPLDPNYPAERTEFMLQVAQPVLLLTQKHLRQKQLSAVSCPIICLDSDWPTIAKESEKNPENITDSRNLAYITYTSGSTGRPKGVMVEHHSLINAYYAWDEAYDLSLIRTHLQMANFAFDGFAGNLTRSLFSGGRLVLCPYEYLLMPEKLYALMLQEKVDMAEFVPVVLRLLIQYLEDSGQSLDFLRIIACSSDYWYVSEYIKFLRFCGPETRLLNVFGVTEATVDSSYFEDKNLKDTADQMVPIGRPYINMGLYILDEQLRLMPSGIPGELYVAGTGISRGYCHQPQLTAERFIPNPFSQNSRSTRLYKTGDLARYLPDGNIEFIGRLDHQVKIRGFRIELGEIESVLVQHPQVAQATVTVHGSESDHKQLVAYVVPKQPLTIDDLYTFLRGKLPDYMVPTMIITLAALPLSPNGKIDRRRLPAPEKSRPVEQYVAPRNAIEEVLAEIWSEVLKIEKVGINDDFFTIGGHSLLATQVVSRIRDRFQINLPLHHLFEATTVASLAEVCKQYETTPGQVEKIASMYQKINQLSEEEVELMLEGKHGVKRVSS